MSDIFIKYALLLSVIIIACLERTWIGLNFGTEDLEFYISDGVSQLSRLGLEKSFLFYPLRFFEDREFRIFILALFMSCLFALCIVLLSEEKRFSFWTFILAILSLYLAQIDMHLVRQQISVYFILISIRVDNKFHKLTTLVLAVLYHEAALLLLASQALLAVGKNYCLLFHRKIILVSALATSLISLAVTGVTSILFSVILMLLFYFSKKFSREVEIFYIALLYICIVHMLYFFGIIYLVNLERLVGTHVAVMFVLLISYGNFQSLQRLLKVSMLAIIFPLYIVLWGASII